MPGARSLQGDRIKYAFLHTFFDNLSLRNPCARGRSDGWARDRWVNRWAHVQLYAY